MSQVCWRRCGPGLGVVLVTGLIATPGEAFGDQEVQRLMLSAEQARRLQDFVWTSLRATDATAAACLHRAPMRAVSITPRASDIQV